jgi:hypothetical protein
MMLIKRRVTDWIRKGEHWEDQKWDGRILQSRKDGWIQPATKLNEEMKSYMPMVQRLCLGTYSISCITQPECSFSSSQNQATETYHKTVLSPSYIHAVSQKLILMLAGVRFPSGARFFSSQKALKTGSGVHLASYTMATGDHFSGSEAARAWSWPLPSI